MLRLIERYDHAVERFPLSEGLVPWPFVERPGPGPTLVLLHGSLGSPHVFFPLFEHLDPDLRIVSFRLPDVLEPQALARDFEACCAALGLADVTMLGTSIGGYIAQFLSPSPRIAAVIPSCAMASMRHMAVLSPARIDEIAAMTPQGMMDAMLDPMLAGWPTGRPELVDVRDFVRARLIPANPPHRYMGRARFVAGWPDAPQMQRDPASVLILSAGDDPVIPPAARSELAARYPDAAHHALSWGGHFPYLARERDYADLVAGFLAARQSSGKNAANGRKSA